MPDPDRLYCMARYTGSGDREFIIVTPQADIYQNYRYELLGDNSPLDLHEWKPVAYEELIQW